MSMTRDLEEEEHDVVLDSQVGQALARRLDRRGLGDGEDLWADRLVYLETEVERLTGEVERLTEESDFLHKLLSDRGSSEALPPGDSPD